MNEVQLLFMMVELKRFTGINTVKYETSDNHLKLELDGVEVEMRIEYDGILSVRTVLNGNTVVIKYEFISSDEDHMTWTLKSYVANMINVGVNFKSLLVDDLDLDLIYFRSNNIYWMTENGRVIIGEIGDNCDRIESLLAGFDYKKVECNSVLLEPEIELKVRELKSDELYGMMTA